MTAPALTGQGSLTACAMAYALAGWPVFPVRPAGKEPLTAHGFKDASTDPERVAAWWHRWPEANIGHPTGVLFDVLDVDVRADGNGWDALHRLNRARLLSGAVATATTRNGGAHLFFPPSGQPCRSLPAHRLDLKAAGGYVLLAPSRVPADDGVPGPGAYSWDDLDPARPAGAPLPWAAVAAVLDPPRPAPPAPRGTGRSGGLAALRDWLAGRTVDRNKSLFWAATRAQAEGLDLEELGRVAVALGLPEREVAATLRSVRKRAGVPV